MINGTPSYICLNNKPSFNEKLTVKSFSAWILDTNTLYHMAEDKHFLIGLWDIFPSPVIMSNGVYDNVVREETSTPGKNWIIQHVLYVPKLNHNLISFS